MTVAVVTVETSTTTTVVPLTPTPLVVVDLLVPPREPIRVIDVGLVGGPPGPPGEVTNEELAEALATKVDTTGDTMTGNLKLSVPAASRLMVDAVADGTARVELTNDGVTRWAMHRDAAGVFAISRYAADGSGQSNPITIDDADGGIYLSGPYVAVPDPLYNKSAVTKDYSDTKVSREGDIMSGPLHVPQELRALNAFRTIGDAQIDGYMLSGNLRQGFGSPEGTQPAPPGTRYVDVNATNGAVEWIKVGGGTTNTGWRVVYGDTGWRWISNWDASGNYDTAPGMVQMRAPFIPAPGRGGYIMVRRVNAEVFLRTGWINSTTPSVGDFLLGAAVLPPGFASEVSGFPSASAGGVSPAQFVFQFTGGDILFQRSGAASNIIVESAATGALNVGIGVADNYIAHPPWIVGTLPGQPFP